MPQDRRSATPAGVDEGPIDRLAGDALLAYINDLEDELAHARAGFFEGTHEETDDGE